MKVTTKKMWTNRIAHEGPCLASGRLAQGHLIRDIQGPTELYGLDTWSADVSIFGDRWVRLRFFEPIKMKERS